MFVVSAAWCFLGLIKLTITSTLPEDRLYCRKVKLSDYITSLDLDELGACTACVVTIKRSNHMIAAGVRTNQVPLIILY